MPPAQGFALRCPCCHGQLLPGCCGNCLQRVARRWDKRQVQQSREALESLLERCPHRHLKIQRCGQLRQRLKLLRSQLQQRSAQNSLRKGQLEEYRERLRRRRSAHEENWAAWQTGRRRLDAKVFVSRAQFLKDPGRHQLGAFHVYQELSVVTAALQQERRRRCNELVEFLPVKWLHMGSGQDVLSLGQVQTFQRSRVLQEDELHHLEAALMLLMRLISALASYLDVTLPFPCSGGRGLREVSSAVEAATAASGVRERHRRSSTKGLAYLARPRAPAGAPQWVLPCVQNPFTRQWHHFGVYDKICTSEFAAVLRLVDQDLLRLCSCQGVTCPENSGTLQLLAALLSAEHLGCMSPPGDAEASEPVAVPPVRLESGQEDGEWTVLCG